MSLSNRQKKRIAIWAVFGAAAIALVAALIFYIKDTFRENDLHTQSVEAVTLLPVTEAYYGKEELLGTSITLEGDNGEHATLTFPEKISEYQPEKAYLITNPTVQTFDYQKWAEQAQADAPRLFKIFFGDKYDEGFLSYFEADDEYGHMIMEEYNGTGGEFGDYTSSGYTLILDDLDLYGEFNEDYGNCENYFYKDYPQITVELSDGTITLQAAAEKFSDYLNNDLGDFNLGFEIRPYKAQVYDTNGRKFITIIGEELYEGIPVESRFSSLNITQNGKFTTYYPAWVEAAMLSVSSYHSIHNYSCVIDNAEPLDKIISLKGAVDILKENLAKNADYTFTDIKLMYCCKSTENEIQVWEEDKEKLKQLIEENDLTEHVYRPTWYFIMEDKNNHTSGIKVDAITGEITMDVP